jgi:hypothetical protein
LEIKSSISQIKNSVESLSTDGIKWKHNIRAWRHVRQIRTFWQ